MLLSDARAWLRSTARNAGESAEYSDAMIDRPILAVLDYVLARLAWPVVAYDVTLTPEDPLVPMAGGSLATFRPGLLVDARMDGAAAPLALPAWQEFVRDTEGMNDGRAAGEPLMLAFEAHTDQLVPTNYTTPHRAVGYLWPAPDGDPWDVLRLRWRVPLTAWTPGDAGAATISIACAGVFVPDDWLRFMLSTVCPALLQGNEPEHGYGQALKGWYDQSFGPLFGSAGGGGGGLGGRSVQLARRR